MIDIFGVLTLIGVGGALVGLTAVIWASIMRGQYATVSKAVEHLADLAEDKQLKAAIATLDKRIEALQTDLASARMDIEYLRSEKDLAKQTVVELTRTVTILEHAYGSWRSRPAEELARTLINEVFIEDNRA